MGLTREVLLGIEERLHEHAGFDLPEWVVETRAAARMSALSLDERGYLELLGSPRGAGELRALVEAVRVGETSFFRHRPQVDALLDVVVPAWRAREEKSPRVWSAGCATGEEPYTIALVLAKAMPRPGFAPSILATDVSAEALASARRATYPAAAWDDVPPPWRDGLLRDGAAVRVRPEVAALVKFQQNNLADADFPRGFDLVWCRNVLIYFGPQARRRVLEKMVGALEPGGFLFVGYSETLRDVAGLSQVRHGDQVLWRKDGSTASMRAGKDVSTASIHAAKVSTASNHRGAAVSRRFASRIEASGPASGGGPVSAGGPASGGEPGREVDSSGPVAAASQPSPRHRKDVSRGGGVQAGEGDSPKNSAGKHAHGSARTASKRDKSSAHMRVVATEPAALAKEIREALGAPGLGSLTIDLDGVDYLGDDVAPVLRRAGAAAEAAGIELLLRATRPGPQRWLRRNGLAGGGE